MSTNRSSAERMAAARAYAAVARAMRSIGDEAMAQANDKLAADAKGEAEALLAGEMAAAQALVDSYSKNRANEEADDATNAKDEHRRAAELHEGVAGIGELELQAKASAAAIRASGDAIKATVSSQARTPTDAELLATYQAQLLIDGIPSDVGMEQLVTMHAAIAHQHREAGRAAKDQAKRTTKSAARIG